MEAETGRQEFNNEFEASLGYIFFKANLQTDLGNIAIPNNNKQRIEVFICMVHLLSKHLTLGFKKNTLKILCRRENQLKLTFSAYKKTTVR